MAVTQRRGQRTGTDAADKKSKEVAPVSPAKLSLQDQLDRAEEAVLKSRDTTAQLHVWWRQHLFRLSMLVLLLSLHQTQVPSTECIKNIKVREEKNRRKKLRHYVFLVEDILCASELPNQASGLILSAIYAHILLLSFFLHCL